MDNLQSWAEVNLDNLTHNLKELKSFLPQDILAVVKAEGYGHGAVEVAETLAKNGVAMLGVATCDEGIALRLAGITTDIIIMAHSLPSRYNCVINNNLIQAISTKAMAAGLSREAVSMNKIARVHVKVDTGMGRIGMFPTEENADEIIEMLKLPSLSTEGVFSHLAESESADTSFTYTQNERYVKFLGFLEKRGFTGFKRHMANSGGILTGSDVYYDMVRPGIILYGIYPSAEVKKPLTLKPMMSVKSRIGHISNIPAGATVGYDRTWTAQRPTKVATVVLGYADGYPSALSNKSRAIAGNNYAPVLGRVCMDQTMLDITDCGELNIGDEVIFLGSKGDLSVTAEELVSLSSAKIRELFCVVGKRLPRVYIKNEKIVKTVFL